MSVCGLVIPLAALGGSGVDLAPTVLVLAFGTLWQTLLWRTALIGLYVGEPGIRLRTLFRARTIPWQDVHRVRVVEDFRYDNRVLVIVAHDGTHVQTPVWQSVRWQSRGPASKVTLPAAELGALAAYLDATVRHVRNASVPDAGPTATTHIEVIWCSYSSTGLPR
jgi:hypothetical protein